VSVDMDKVSVMVAYCDPLCVRACVCVVHCIWRQPLYKAPWWWILCDPKHVRSSFKYFI